MKRERIDIEGIPALVWGEPSEKVWLFVHGKLSSKEAAEGLAAIADERGWQTLSFDLPGHGERADAPGRCDIWNGMRDLNAVCRYAFSHWSKAALFGCSLGAYFSLNTCGGYPFEKCLFQSPIVDMEYLIGQMMLWFGVTPERLEREREIPTPVDTLSWDYYRYVLAHPTEKWPIPTAILYGGKDTLQSIDVMRAFTERFGCDLTVEAQCEHPFMAEGDGLIVERWLKKHI